MNIIKSTLLTALLLFVAIISIAQEKQVDPIHEQLLGTETLEVFKRVANSMDLVAKAGQEAREMLEAGESGEYNARVKLKTSYVELGKTKNNLNYLLEKFEESEQLAEQLNCPQTKNEVSATKSHLLATLDYLGFSMDHLSLFISSGNFSGLKSFQTQFNAFDREFGSFSDLLIKGYTACLPKVETKTQTVPTPIVVELPQSVKKEPVQPETPKPSVDKSKIDLGIYFGKGKESDIYEVFRVYEGSKAEKAGIKEEDFLLKIDGLTLNKKYPDEVKELLNGPVGSTVTMTIDRDGDVQDIVIVR